jgi:hypothetical protein
MKRARSGITSRGVENPTLDPLIQSYEIALADYSKAKCYYWSDLERLTQEKFKLQDRDPSLVIARDVRKMAKSMNLMNGFDFADIVDRSSAIRIFFLVATGDIPLDKAIPAKGMVRTPSKILAEFAENELSQRIKFDYLTKISDRFQFDDFVEGYELFKSWFFGGMKPINSNFGNRYLSRDCYRDSLNAMRVPIWEARSSSEPFVKGSYKDPYRDLDQDLFTGTVISMNRLG